MILTWSKNCVLTDMTAKAAATQGNPSDKKAPAGATFSITAAKLYFSVVTLSAKLVIRAIKNRI